MRRRRVTGWRRHLTWRRLSLIVLVGVVGGAAWLLLFSSTLSVQDVTVSGTTTLTTKQVLNAADVPTGGPLLTADLDAASVRVGNLPAVADVDVTRQWPHTVHITVVERMPIAVITIGGRMHALDATGAVFDDYAKAPPGLPRVTVAGGSADDTDGLAQVAAVVSALPADLRAVTDHVELRSADDIQLALTDDRVVRWGDSSQSDVKAQVLATLLSRKAKVYDVSVPGSPVTSD